MIPSRHLQSLKKYTHICALTGAGMSTESGIATFRGSRGLWSKMRPEELASPQGLRANPGLVWEWYQRRREIVSSSIPNSGHYALARWESLADSFVVVAQNVDRLH
jgi:NAD-dependent deacetylase